MATPFQALVAEIRALDGAPKVTYPEGSAAHPVTERVLRLRRGTQAPVFGQAEPDAAQFPNNTLTAQTELKNDAQYVEVYRKYEVLPGPIVVEITVDPQLVIPVLIAKQQVWLDDDLTEGEIIPAPVNVTSIAAAVNGVSTVTLASSHGLPPKAWVAFAGTNSTPSLNGNQRIVDVPAPNQITVAANVTVAGSTGTMTGLNHIVRELKTNGSTLVGIKVDTMAAVPDVSVYNEDFACWKDYTFPSFLKSVNFYNDQSFSVNTLFDPDAVPASSHSSGGGIGLPMQAGYRGPCRARRLRMFFVGAPQDNFTTGLTPTIIIPSIGTFVIEGVSDSVKGYAGAYQSVSRSNNFRVGSIDACLTGPSPTVNKLLSTMSPINIVSIFAGAFPLITLASAHGLTIGQYVRITGSNSTPPLDGVFQVIATPSSTTLQVTAPVALSGAGTTAGTVVLTGSAFGSGQATCALDLPQSVPPKFVAGLEVTAIGTGSSPTISLGADHYLHVGQFVNLSGTNSTPPLDGFQQVTAIPAGNQIQVQPAAPVTGAGTAGALDAVITLMEEPQKLNTAALWEVVVWQIIVPYTSGATPPG